MNAQGNNSVPDRKLQRILKDFDELMKNPLPFLRDCEVKHENDERLLRGILIGPDGSDYAGGYFRFHLYFWPSYPFIAPELFFSTLICHPNVSQKDGALCADDLRAAWSPRTNLRTVFESIYELLVHPSYEIPIEGGNEVTPTPELARQWTRAHAQSDEKN